MKMVDAWLQAAADGDLRQGSEATGADGEGGEHDRLQASFLAGLRLHTDAPLYQAWFGANSKGDFGMYCDLMQECWRRRPADRPPCAQPSSCHVTRAPLECAGRGSQVRGGPGAAGYDPLSAKEGAGQEARQGRWQRQEGEVTMREAL